MSLLELVREFGKDYINSLFTTWGLTVLTFTLSLFLGTALTVLRICPIKIVRLTSEVYIQIFRNIPGAALLSTLVYALPYLEIVLSYFACVVIATVLIVSSFVSENLLSGVNTIRKGQIEAARSLGFSFLQIIFYIIVPQALRFSILPLTNLAVATMLTTALASQVPLNPRDLTGLVDYINTHALGGITAFVISAALYCATAAIIGQVGNFLDKKLRIKR